MRNWDDPAFPGSICTVIADSAVEQPEGITRVQDCDVVPSDNQTMIDVPVENQDHDSRHGSPQFMLGK